MNTTKPGYKTTEFWLTLLANLVGLLILSGLIEPGTPWDKALGLASMVLSNLGYYGVRGRSKQGANETGAPTPIMDQMTGALRLLWPDGRLTTPALEVPKPLDPPSASPKP